MVYKYLTTLWSGTGGSQRAIENEIPENMEETGNANMANEIPEEVNMNNKANMENVIMSEEIQLETVPVNMVKDTEIVADSVTMVTGGYIRYPGYHGYVMF